MEGSKQEGSSSSSSSFTSDLFGFKELSTSSSASTGVFDSIFSPSPKVGKGSLHLRPGELEKKQIPGTAVWDARSQGNVSQRKEDANSAVPYADSNAYLQQEKAQPCHLSSSIYYGGQEHYSQPSDTNHDGTQPTFKKDGGEDDGRASRGNWWKGSLYY